MSSPNAASSRAASVLAAGALVLLAASPAAAHPNPTSQDLQAGHATTITVFLFADEGPVTGVDVTVPSSFHLSGATGDARLPTVTTTDDTVMFREAAGGSPLESPSFSTVVLQGTPTALPLYLHFVAQRVGQSPYDYGMTLVTAPMNAANPSTTGRNIAVTAGVLAVGGIAAGTFELRRRRRRRPAIGAQ